MEKAPATRIVRIPDDGQVKAIFEAYATAVGRVAHAWNFLQERLGRVFVAVTRIDREIAAAIWYSTENDRTQRGMLKAAIMASPDERWTSIHVSARDDLIWLIERTEAIAEQRNNAIHAPCTLVIDVGGAEMAAPYYAGHPRARRLRGAKLLIEFDWAERAAETLSLFAERVDAALSHAPSYSWPDRPVLPDRRPRKIPQGQPRPPRTKSRQRQPQSSPS
jgi:hypothetical protein